jgi:hypothetical protein
VSRAARTALLLLTAATLGGVAWWAMESGARWRTLSSREVPWIPDAAAADESRVDDAPPTSPPTKESAGPSAPTRESETRPAGDTFSTVSLHGTVVDADGAAIVGARVQVIEPRGTVQATFETGGDGAFKFDPLPSYCTLLHASAPGHRSKLVSVDRPECWPMYEHLQIPARIVLEPAVVAVARVVWDDGKPCARCEVRVRSSSSANYWAALPDCGAWPPPRTDEEGRVVLRGLPANRLLAFGAAVYGGDEDRLRLFESGSATTDDAAVEQRFTYARVAKLTVVLHGLESLAEREAPVVVVLEPENRGAMLRNFSVAPKPCVFEHVVLGSSYSVRLEAPGGAAAVLTRRLAIVELDQHVAFDCTVPSPPPAPEPRGALLCFRLRDADGSVVTERQLVERAMWPCYLRLNYGSRDPGDGRTGAKTLAMAPDTRDGVGLCAREWLDAMPPLWADAALGELHALVEVGAAEPGDIELRFDFAQHARHSAEVTFRGRDGTGRDRPLEAVTIFDAESLTTRTALGAGSATPRCRLPIGRWSFRATTTGDAQAASGSFEVSGPEPQFVDVALLDCGAIRGRVAPSPDASAGACRTEIVRSPADGVRGSFDWWKCVVVEGDGNYELLAVPPGEWTVMLRSTAPDGLRVRCESAPVTVLPNAIARLDFAPTGARTTEYGFDLGGASCAFVHVTDRHGRTCFDGHVTPHARIELGGDSLRFRAAPGETDAGYASFDQLQFTEGDIVPAAPAGPVLVRFAFPSR